MKRNLEAGVEMEPWVVDDHGRLCNGVHLAGAHERVTPEFVDPLPEVRTAPQRTRRRSAGT